MTSHEQAHAEHMERVYAVQRRSAYLIPENSGIR